MEQVSIKRYKFADRDMLYGLYCESCARAGLIPRPFETFDKTSAPRLQDDIEEDLGIDWPHQFDRALTVILVASLLIAGAIALLGWPWR